MGGPVYVPRNAHKSYGIVGFATTFAEGGKVAYHVIQESDFQRRPRGLEIVLKLWRR
jgi:hypothetical protein